MQSTLDNRTRLHVAVIMDGNGRWAKRKGLARAAGHRAGLSSARRIVETAANLGVGTLTLFAFSSDNWRRPVEEVDTLMSLARAYLHLEKQHLAERGIRLSVIGRRDRLPSGLAEEIGAAEQSTAAGDGLHLRIALDYSSRDAILRAAATVHATAAPSLDQFAHLIAGSGGTDGGANVDLLIRSGGEKRLSDFLLWESAYAELWFTDKMWPDFGPDDFRLALDAFHQRERRYGGLASVA
jgi:undecaprenyl diphosphate synthase